MTIEQQAAVKCINLIRPGSKFANMQRIADAFGLQGKRCCRCKEFKPATREHFKPSLQQRDGLHTICRECYNRDYNRYTSKQKTA